jgi:hypothetical protein
MDNRTRRRLPGVLCLLACGFATCAGGQSVGPAPAREPAGDPPWLVRATFPGEDGAPIEMLGAPGPRTVAHFLRTAMGERVADAELLEVRRRLPEFYEVRVDGKLWSVEAPAIGKLWSIEARAWDKRGTWSGDDEELREWAKAVPDVFARHMTPAQFALARNDVIWKWPRAPGPWFYLRAPRSPASIGTFVAKQLRAKLDAGRPLAEAWFELRFQEDGSYVLDLLPDGRLRIALAPEWDLPDVSAWTGAY